MENPIPQFAHLVSELKRQFPELAYLQREIGFAISQVLFRPAN